PWSKKFGRSAAGAAPTLTSTAGSAGSTRCRSRTKKTRMEHRPQSAAMRHPERELRARRAVLDSRESSLYNPRAPSSAVPRGRGAQVAQLVEHCTENAGVGGSIPPLGTTSDTLWFGLGSRFARGLPICSMRPPFITTTRPANVMAGLLKELTTGLWSSFTRWEAFGISDANSAVT